jgi:hypothetical protein
VRSWIEALPLILWDLEVQLPSQRLASLHGVPSKDGLPGGGILELLVARISPIVPGHAVTQTVHLLAHRHHPGGAPGRWGGCCSSNHQYTHLCKRGPVFDRRNSRSAGGTPITPLVFPRTTIANIQQVILECQNAGVGIIVGTAPPFQDDTTYDEVAGDVVYQWLTTQMTQTTGATSANYISVLSPSTTPPCGSTACGWVSDSTTNGVIPDTLGYTEIDPVAYQSITTLGSSLTIEPK